MIINILQPQSFSEIGRKDNQEDFLWPSPEAVTTDQRVFIMCDGVGGQDSGEVASQTAGTALGEYITSHWPEDGIMTKDLFNEALSFAYDELDKADTGAERKMGTTMTCIVLHRGGVLLAHIGDSRIYQIRPTLSDVAKERSGIVYQTEDHSLVNDLLRMGEITQEEAINFPQKNVITRAMQPNQERRSRADIINIADVQQGDFFFLCCDGVLEKVNNLTLGNILANKELDNSAKIASIKSICDSGTRDNYTCWLVPIGEIIPEEIDMTLMDDEEDLSIEVAAAEEEDIDYEAGKANAAEIAARKEARNEAEQSEEEVVEEVPDEYDDSITEFAPRKTATQAAPAFNAPAPARPAPHLAGPRARKGGLSTSAIVAVALAVVAVAGAIFAYFTFFKKSDAPTTKKTVRTEVTSSSSDGGSATVTKTTTTVEIHHKEAAAPAKSSAPRPHTEPANSPAKQDGTGYKLEQVQNIPGNTELSNKPAKSEEKPNPKPTQKPNPKPSPKPSDTSTGDGKTWI